MTTARENESWAPLPRCTRWYEWLVILLLLAFAGGVRAASVYKCTSPDGAISYQDLPCVETQRERLLELDPAPEYQPSPQYALDATPRAPARGGGRGERSASAEPAAFECRAADGAVFYRHSGCPHSLAPGATGGGRSQRGAGKGAPVSVSARRITRDEACRAIHSAGAIGRAGHEHDDDVSTYDRNLGRDPCR